MRKPKSSAASIRPTLVLLALLALVLLRPELSSAQWVEQDVQFSTGGRDVFSIDAIDENVVWALAGDVEFFSSIQEFSRTTNGGITWIPGTVTGASGLVACCVSALDANTAWVAYGDPINVQLTPRILKTTDGGATWTHQSTAFPQGGNGAFCDVVHAFDSNRGVAIGDPHGGYFEIYTTTNGGTNWVRVPEANIPAELPGEFGLIPGPSFCARGNTVWFGTNKGRVLRSTDLGVTWTVAATNLGETAFINDVAFRDANHGLATALINFFNPGMARTTDGGSTWIMIPPISSPAPFFLAAVPPIPAYVMTSYGAGGGSGSALTLDDGDTWTVIDGVVHGAVDFVSPSVGWSGGMTRESARHVQDASFSPSADRNGARVFPSTAFPADLYASKLAAISRRPGMARGSCDGALSPSASHEGSVGMVSSVTEGGMWKWNGTVLGMSGPTHSASAGALLHSSYPNPFNPAATIEFVLPTAGHVFLGVYNSTGAKVATLVDKELGLGVHAVPWRANHVASGVYFYRIETGDATAGGRMVLAK